LRFDLDGIKEVSANFLAHCTIPTSSLHSIANVDGFDFSENYIPVHQRPEIDQWVLSSLNTLIKKVNEAMDDYEPTIAGRLIEEFLDEHLSNWYVRLCRRRFWKGEYEQDKIAAYQTLYECLETITRLMAPISPFFSDAVFKNLDAVTKRLNTASVHHTDFPVANENLIDEGLEERMQLAQDISSLILSLRKKTNIKVRQPLHKALIPVLNTEMKLQLQKVEDLIKTEVNIKEIELVTEADNIIHKRVKPNFKLLGSKLGSGMKEATALFHSFPSNRSQNWKKQAFLI
jgi:isoleucyl-tRNA synthetase